MMDNNELGRAPTGQALVNEAPAGLHPSGFDPSRFCDAFNGDNIHLLSCAEALLDLDSAGALVPHGVGGHGRAIINALASRLARIEAASDPGILGDLECKVMSYDWSHQDAVKLGYPSILEVLEAAITQDTTERTDND